MGDATEAGFGPNFRQRDEFNAYGSLGLASAPPVTLSVASSPNNMVTLTWTTNVWVNLNYTTSLNPPTTWTPVTNPPSIVNGQWNVTLSIGTNRCGFYRLQY